MRSYFQSISEWLYSALIRMYPSEFRRDFGRRLETQFRDEFWSEASTRKWTGLVRLWAATIQDLLVSVAREWTADLSPDFRHGARRLFHHPTSTTAATLTVALAVGINTATFSVVDAVLLRPLPFTQPDRLVRVTALNPRFNARRATWSDFFRWREQRQLFFDAAAYTAATASLGIGQQDERVLSASVTDDFFRMLSARPAMGRLFQKADYENRGGSVILSDAIWRRSFGADPAVIGKAVRVDGRTAAVIGVMSPGFRFLNREIDIWTPLLDSGSATAAAAPLLEIFARLQPGLTIRRAQSELRGLDSGLVNEGGPAAGYEPRVLSLREELVHPVQKGLVILMTAVILVLLIAGVNLTSLQHARNAGRAREFAIRASLGASRARLVRQVLAESALLSAAGGAFGLLLCRWAMPLIWRAAPASINRFPSPAIDGAVLLCALFASTIVVLFAGLLPAAALPRTDLACPVNAGFSWRNREPRGFVRRGMLIVPEIALAVALVVTAGLLARSFWKVSRQDNGFDPRSLLTASMLLDPGYFGQPERQLSFHDRVLEGTRALPGVEGAALTTWLPITDTAHWWQAAFDGPVSALSDAGFRAGQSAVTPDYFRVMRMPLLEGRGFSDADTRDSTPVAIINRSMARDFYPNMSPLGRRIRLGTEMMPWLTIVGVVADIHHVSPEAPPLPETYVPFAQYRYLQLAHLVLRTRADSPPPASLVLARIRGVDRNLAVFPVLSMEDRMASLMAPRRFQALLLSIFGAMAVVLVLVGVYGTLSRIVAGRRHEIAVRLALGARPQDAVRLVLGHVALLGAGGTIAGIAIALACGRYLGSLLYGVTATDPLTYVASAAAVLAACTAACWGPARRASMTDPVELFRDAR